MLWGKRELHLISFIMVPEPMTSGVRQLHNGVLFTALLQGSVNLGWFQVLLCIAHYSTWDKYSDI